MMKINNFIKKTIVSLLSTLILASCNIDVEWNGKFQDDLGRYIITPVTFFANDTDTYGQSMFRDKDGCLSIVSEGNVLGFFVWIFCLWLVIYE